MLCVVSILRGNDVVDDSLWPVYRVVCRLHLVRCRLAPVFTDCGHTNFSVKLINGENYIVRSFNDIYSSPSIIWVMKLRRLRWTGHVAHMGLGKVCIQDFVGET